MTDVNPNNIITQEVSLYDEDGQEYTDANPIPVTTVSSVLSTVLASILASVLIIEATIGVIAASNANILTDLQSKADLVENQPVTIYDSTNTNPADVINYEGQTSLSINIAYQETFTVHLDVTNQSGTVGYMLIDLSNTATWPHINTAHIIIKHIIIQSSQSTSPAFLGNIRFGFLGNVDATDGDFYRIGVLQGDRSTTLGNGSFDFSTVGLGLETDEWFGPTTANDVTWQTDVNLLGPDGNTSYPAGNGDLVCKLISTAGTISFGVTVIYTTASD